MTKKQTGNRFEVYQRRNGQWGVRLIAANGETVVPPEGYIGSSTRGREAAEAIRRAAAGARIVVMR